MKFVLLRRRLLGWSCVGSDTVSDTGVISRANVYLGFLGNKIQGSSSTDSLCGGAGFAFDRDADMLIEEVSVY